jgi:hypothetical protein
MNGFHDYKHREWFINMVFGLPTREDWEQEYRPSGPLDLCEQWSREYDPNRPTPKALYLTDDTAWNPFPWGEDWVIACRRDSKGFYDYRLMKMSDPKLGQASPWRVYGQLRAAK